MNTLRRAGVAREPGRLYPADRIKAFVDAVVAIAMTLLILPLMESASDLGNAGYGIGDWFSEQSGQLLTFLISFAVIGSFWLGHHGFFSHVEFISDGLLVLLLIWLLTVVWLPVATALTGHSSGSDTATVLMYIGSMLATSVLGLLIHFYVTARPPLHTATSANLKEGMVGSAGSVILFVAAGAIAALFPAVGYAALLVTCVGGPLDRLLRPLLSRWNPTPGSAQPEVPAEP